jgi:hypothetical protein
MMFQLGFLLALPFGYFLCIGHAKLTLAYIGTPRKGDVKRQIGCTLSGCDTTHPSLVPSYCPLAPTETDERCRSSGSYPLDRHEGL